MSVRGDTATARVEFEEVRQQREERLVELEKSLVEEVRAEQRHRNQLLDNDDELDDDAVEL